MIRPARDADLPLVHALAELDTSAPLAGRILVAVVDGRPWAALSLDDGRAVADPFAPSATTVELLRVRADQLRAADSKHRRVALTRWIAGRARA
ncbi:MAG: hypothetical protein M3401_00220 [Actinomycetota bacterium]|nr:hypothetical protein [Actinomycetota bacterium]